MESTKTSWTARYLKVAGLLSACLGLISFALLLLALREGTPETKLYLGISALIGIVIGYAIGKDVTDRLRNHEESAASITNGQMRLASAGARFGIALSRLVLLVLLISIAVFSIHIGERVALFCPAGDDFWQCYSDFTGIPLE